MLKGWALAGNVLYKEESSLALVSASLALDLLSLENSGCHAHPLENGNLRCRHAREEPKEKDSGKLKALKRCWLWLQTSNFQDYLL